jgi:hypothetical protein
MMGIHPVKSIAAGDAFALGCSAAGACVHFFAPADATTVTSFNVDLNEDAVVTGGQVDAVLGMDGSDNFAAFLISGAAPRHGDSSSNDSGGDENQQVNDGDDDGDDSVEDTKIPATTNTTH